MHTNTQDWLAEPFAPDEIEWKAQATRDNRALAVAYIDARCVMERLDNVVGIDGWQDSYELLPDGNVVCRLAVRIGGEWITKSDVGGESDQKDPGDKRKAAFSDALKRAAVKFGIGRYLYSLPAQWVDYDQQRKQLVGTPRLPQWALPRAKPQEAPAPPPPQDTPTAPPTRADEYLGLLERAKTREAYDRACASIRHIWSDFRADERQALGKARDAAAVRLGFGDELEAQKQRRQENAAAAKVG